MDEPTRYNPSIGVSDVYVRVIDDLAKAVGRRTRVKILIVVDGSLSLTESVSGFGVGRVIRLLRESAVGCTTFKVDLARREGPVITNAAPTAGQPRYTGFRFDQLDSGAPVLNRYHEVWCFGFNPDNFAGPDSNITQASALPTTEAELEALTVWMNDKRGGVLAMGDHDYLGASMCHRIPRVGSMRRWTNAQGVPPIGGATHPDTALRHDTNQPATAGQISGGALIPFDNQGDATPQHIDWVPWISQQLSIFSVTQRPHPVLCHPTLGPIDVMPDHPHEGWCFEDDEIDLTATYSFAGLSGDEYPTVAGNQPQPHVIAHGTTTPNPPFNLEKGPSPKKRFAMITTYDGHPAGVGRVVADSTWHHWFDINITALEAAGGANWDKVSRYYLNVATWLSPVIPATWCLPLDILASHFSYLGFQEYSPAASVFDLGHALHYHLGRIYGPCWVTSWVFDQIQLVDDNIWAWLKDRLFWRKGIPVPGGDPCLSCPSFELFEIAVLGGVVKAGLPLAQEIKQRLSDEPDQALDMDIDRIVEEQRTGVAVGLKELRSAIARSVEELQPLLG